METSKQSVEDAASEIIRETSSENEVVRRFAETAGRAGLFGTSLYVLAQRVERARGTPQEKLRHRAQEKYLE